MLSTPLRALDGLAEMDGKDGHSSWGAWWELGTDPGSYLSSMMGVIVLGT